MRANYLKLLPEDRAARILEIGPGMGELLHLLTKERGYTNVGAIDVSPEVVQHCSELYCPTSCVADSVDFLEKHREQFELVFMLHVLEHVSKAEIVPLVRAIHSALRPGGKLIIEVPNMANPIIGLTARYADFTHEVGFTASSLHQVLSLGGFTEAQVIPSRIPLTSVARVVQYCARGVLELLFRLLTATYTTDIEPNSANIVAVAIRDR